MSRFKRYKVSLRKIDPDGICIAAASIEDAIERLRGYLPGLGALGFRIEGIICDEDLTDVSFAGRCESCGCILVDGSFTSEYVSDEEGCYLCAACAAVSDDEDAAPDAATNAVTAADVHSDEDHDGQPAKKASPVRVPMSGRDPEDGRDEEGTPTAEKLSDGQYRDHWVLSEEERAKGFVRPVRESYRHVGPAGPKHELFDLSEEQLADGLGDIFAKWEPYPEKVGTKTGRFWTQDELDRVAKGGCGGETRMPLKIAETYARQPKFYGTTFCCRCHDYLPVGADGEFIWIDGSGERVGT